MADDQARLTFEVATRLRDEGLAQGFAQIQRGATGITEALNGIQAVLRQISPDVRGQLQAIGTEADAVGRRMKTALTDPLRDQIKVAQQMRQEVGAIKDVLDRVKASGFQDTQKIYEGLRARQDELAMARQRIDLEKQLLDLQRQQEDAIKRLQLATERYGAAGISIKGQQGAVNPRMLATESERQIAQIQLRMEAIRGALSPTPESPEDPGGDPSRRGMGSFFLRSNVMRDVRRSVASVAALSEPEGAGFLMGSQYAIRMGSEAFRAGAVGVAGGLTIAGVGIAVEAFSAYAQAAEKAAREQVSLNRAMEVMDIQGLRSALQQAGAELDLFQQRAKTVTGAGANAFSRAWRAITFQRSPEAEVGRRVEAEEEVIRKRVIPMFQAEAQQQMATAQAQVFGFQRGLAFTPERIAGLGEEQVSALSRVRKAEREKLEDQFVGERKPFDQALRVAEDAMRKLHTRRDIGRDEFGNVEIVTTPDEEVVQAKTKAQRDAIAAMEGRNKAALQAFDIDSKLKADQVRADVLRQRVWASTRFRVAPLELATRRFTSAAAAAQEAQAGAQFGFEMATTPEAEAEAMAAQREALLRARSIGVQGLAVGAAKEVETLQGQARTVEGLRDLGTVKEADARKELARLGGLIRTIQETLAEDIETYGVETARLVAAYEMRREQALSAREQARQQAFEAGGIAPDHIPYVTPRQREIIAKEAAERERFEAMKAAALSFGRGDYGRLKGVLSPDTIARLLADEPRPGQDALDMEAIVTAVSRVAYQAAGAQRAVTEQQLRSQVFAGEVELAQRFGGLRAEEAQLQVAQSRAVLLGGQRTTIEMQAQQIIGGGDPERVAQVIQQYRLAQQTGQGLPDALRAIKRTELRDDQIQQFEALTAQLQNLGLSAEMAGQQVRGALAALQLRDDPFAGLMAGLRDTANAFGGWGLSIQRAVDDTFRGVATSLTDLVMVPIEGKMKSLSEMFGNLGKSILRSVVQGLSQDLVSGISRQLLGALTGAAGAGGYTPRGVVPGWNPFRS